MEVPNTSTDADCPDAASQRIVVEIRRRLCSTGHHVLRLIEPEVCDGAVVLRGRVPTYYLKQLAQSVLLTDRLVETIVNLIEVPQNGHKGIATY
ncbi:MAG: hypothetical protein ABIK89_16125 [Planctomycetota bacterium]